METAGLTELLRQEGSYTVFAPTDDAFAALTREDLEFLKSQSAYLLSFICFLEVFEINMLVFLI